MNDFEIKKINITELAKVKLKGVMWTENLPNHSCSQQASSPDVFYIIFAIEKRITN